jgi:hypothetical protein
VIEFDRKAFELLGKILEERNIPNDQGYRLDKKEWAAEALARLGYQELAEAIARRRGRPPKGAMSAKSAIETLKASDDPSLRHLGYFLAPPPPSKLSDQRVMADWVKQEMMLTGLEYPQAAYQVAKRANGWSLQEIKMAYKREFKK